jgi:hypothetical protein
MKAEAWTFGAMTIFVAVVAPIYWFSSHELTGFLALVMTSLLSLIVTLYLAVHATRMKQPRPEDNPNAEIAEGAGELGFFPPYSWWPFWGALTLATVVFGIAVHVWVVSILGAGLGFIAAAGWVFEYYRGDHAH